MEPASPVSGTSEDRKKDEQPVRKRKRTTLSCLQCVKRKAKCDKVHPCSTCISRKEAHLCEFEDGAAPAPAQATVSMDEFMALKARLDSIEHAPKTASPQRFTPASLDASPKAASTFDRSKAGDLEVTLSTIEALAAGHGAPDYLDRRVSAPATPVSPATGPWPRVSLSCPEYHSRGPKWIRDMTEALAKLPDPQTVKAIVDFFFEECLMTRIYLYRPVFEAELADFERHRTAGTQMKVDPAWAALLTSVLWASLITLKTSPVKSPVPREYCENISGPLLEAFDTFLACAEWIGKPQIRVLFALIITIPPHGPIPFNQRDEKWHGQAFRSMWFDAALSIARCLGLHLLAKDKPLPDDPMLPKHLPTLARQICTQAWHATWLYDSFMMCGASLYAGAGTGRIIPPFIIQDGTYDTAPLGNYREDDLLTQPYPTPVSKYEITWDSMAIHKNILGTHWRKIIEGLRNPEELTYEKVLKIDRDLRSAANVIENLLTGQELKANEAIMFDLLQSSYHFRLLRLHRPFFLQSFTDSRYHFTKVSIVEAARIVTKANRRLLTRYAHRPAVQQAVYLAVHHLGALVVMFLHAMLDPRSLDEMRDEITLSRDVLVKANAQNPAYFQRIGGRGIKAANLMLETLESQRDPVAVENIEQLVNDVLQDMQAPDPPSVEPSVDAFVMPAEADFEMLLKSWTSMQAAPAVPWPANGTSANTTDVGQQNWWPELKMGTEFEVDWNNVLRGF